MSISCSDYQQDFPKTRTEIVNKMNDLVRPLTKAFQPSPHSMKNADRSPFLSVGYFYRVYVGKLLTFINII